MSTKKDPPRLDRPRCIFCGLRFDREPDEGWKFKRRGYCPACAPGYDDDRARNVILSVSDRRRLCEALKALVDAIDRYLDDAGAAGCPREILVPIPKDRPTSKSTRGRVLIAWGVKAAVIRVQKAYWAVLADRYMTDEGGPLPRSIKHTWIEALAYVRGSEIRIHTRDDGSKYVEHRTGVPCVYDGERIYGLLRTLQHWAVVERDLIATGVLSPGTVAFVRRRLR